LQQRHHLELSPGAIKQITEQSQLAVDLSQFHGNWEFKLVSWCEQQGLGLDCLKSEENEEEFEEEDYEIQWAIVEELMEKQAYDRLDQLREALKIGKFAFVHPTPEA
jgi:hypothetical protein